MPLWNSSSSSRPIVRDSPVSDEWEQSRTGAFAVALRWHTMVINVDVKYFNVSAPPLTFPWIGFLSLVTSSCGTQALDPLGAPSEAGWYCQNLQRLALLCYNPVWIGALFSRRPPLKMKFTLPILLALSARAQLDSLTVNTQQGPVSGTLSAPTVRQFLGVPFARAGRWEAPQLPAIRKNVFKATAFGDSCVQELSPSNVEFLELAGGLGINTTESENCLTVNIWSPSVKRKQKTAVLLWIYGGGTVFGTVSYYRAFLSGRIIILILIHFFLD